MLGGCACGETSGGSGELQVGVRWRPSTMGKGRRVYHRLWMFSTPFVHHAFGGGVGAQERARLNRGGGGFRVPVRSVPLAFNCPCPPTVLYPPARALQPLFQACSGNNPPACMPLKRIPGPHGRGRAHVAQAERLKLPELTFRTLWPATMIKATAVHRFRHPLDVCLNPFGHEGLWDSKGHWAVNKRRLERFSTSSRVEGRGAVSQAPPQHPPLPNPSHI